MTTFYDNQPQSESLTLEQRQQHWHDGRWMGEDDWLFAPPEGVTVYNIETMLKDDCDDEGIPNIHSSQMWSYRELNRNEANEFLTTLNPDLILISFTQQGDYDEF